MFLGHCHMMSTSEHVLKLGQITDLISSSIVSQEIYRTAYSILCCSRYYIHVCVLLFIMDKASCVWSVTRIVGI